MTLVWRRYNSLEFQRPHFDWSALLYSTVPCLDRLRLRCGLYSWLYSLLASSEPAINPCLRNSIVCTLLNYSGRNDANFLVKGSSFMIQQSPLSHPTSSYPAVSTSIHQPLYSFRCRMAVFVLMLFFQHDRLPRRNKDKSRRKSFDFDCWDIMPLRVSGKTAEKIQHFE